MNSKMYALAVAALLGCFAWPVVASPVEVAVDDREVETTELDDSESGWEWGASVGLTYHSKYVIYGLTYNQHGVLVPNVELSWGHEDYFTLAVGVDTYFDMTNYGAKDGCYSDRRWKYSELDPYISLSRTWALTEDVGLYTEAGYFYEYHPRSCNKPDLGYRYADAQYFTFVIGLEDNILNPTFTLEYQVAGAHWGEDSATGKGGLYATFELSHTFDISNWFGLDEEAVVLTPTVGIATANKNRNQLDLEMEDTWMFRDAFARLEMVYSPCENLSITPYIACHQQLDADARAYVRENFDGNDFVGYAGIGISYEF